MDDANPREAFLPAPEGGRSFHARAVDAARPHRERVAADLSKLAFERVFPELAAALAAQAPDAPLPEVRDAALIFLYRLLFLFYAEDRGLLPVLDPRYGAYALRDNVRRRCGPAHGRGRRLLRTRGALLDDDRRPVPDHRRGR